jgi:hypothetical protein
MPSLQRPTCEYGGIGGCNKPATRLVCFGDELPNVPEYKQGRPRRWLMSCAKHAEYWRNRGGYWVTSLMGWCSDPARREELASYLRDESDDGSCVCGAPDRAKDHDCPARL